MSKELITENNNFEVELRSLGYRTSRLKSLKIDGKTGAITLIGATSLTGALTLTGNLTMTGTLKPSKAILPTNAFLVVAHLGKNGAGAVTLTGAAIGDKVIGAVNLTTPGDAKSLFESTITVANQIQQSSATDLSAAQIQFIILKQS